MNTEHHVKLAETFVSGSEIDDDQHAQTHALISIARSLVALVEQGRAK